LKFWTFISSSNKTFLEHIGTIFYIFQKDLSNGVIHTPIKNHLIHALKGFVVKNQFSNLTHGPSFDRNSCILCLNKQCKGPLGIYNLKSFQGYPKGSIWCFLAISTKALNIQNSHTSVTPKVGMHLGVIKFRFLHSPPFVTLFWPHGPLHSTLSHELDIKIETIWNS
jgi:hypothetical protein